MISLYPFSARYDDTVRTSSSPGINNTRRVTHTIATSPEGSDFVNFGRNWIIAIVSTINQSMIHISELGSHSSQTLNCSIWAINIIIASPFTNQSITEWGMSRTNFPSQKTQNNICNAHMSIRVAKRYSMPYVTTRDVITTARAHVAPDIIPGLPQKIAVKSPTINAAWSQTIGFTPATNEKAIASGTRASATVSPERISVLSWEVFCNSEKYHFLCM